MIDAFSSHSAILLSARHYATVAKWLRRWSAKPVFVDSNSTSSSTLCDTTSRNVGLVVKRVVSSARPTQIHNKLCFLQAHENGSKVHGANDTGMRH